MSDRPPSVVWFRRDLRLADNPALTAAAHEGGPVVPVFVLDPAEDIGGASRWWLHQSLEALDADLARQGLPLVLRRGSPATILADLARETGARSVHWGRRYEPASRVCEEAVEQALARNDVVGSAHATSLLVEPWSVTTGDGGSFRVYSAFWRAVRRGTTPSRPLPVPGGLRALPRPPKGDDLAAWRLLPEKPDWAGGLRRAWRVGEAAARERLAHFLDELLAGYADQRDRFDRETTSRLSPHLHWGEISPRQIWYAVQAHAGERQAGAGAEKFLAELGWREFSYHLLWHFPALRTEPMRPAFARFPWHDDTAALEAWQGGRTGYPMVDAGMRQLWAEGWLPNRVRMVVASFLTKHLLQPWQAGERWFWDTLVDADGANNGASWQWVAGSGADAAPYFRIFNPILQGRKFDPEGDYVRRWVPELAAVPGAAVHEPRTDLLGASFYPPPIIDHAAARARALAAYATIAG